ncbi:hypothetical protein [Mesorhizobium sp.]|uniref:hypothetical protein n=1 Tax=Mesorhizobium sp. TaxID=1871066 RepID=UPI000FE8BECA|nr:hypothetical protein [Mesorhizobium sp.]RWB60448.1 MAG: hypothetical protein EOQ47_02805 [Mesorhizobium sp.]
MKRVMHDLKIDELSAVTSMAQTHAKAVIMKSMTKQKADVVSFATFEGACEYLRKAGLAGTEAMREARNAYPQLFAKSQERDHVQTDEERTIAKARAGRARQNQIDVLIHGIALGKCISRTDALRLIRKSNPELFD